MLNAQLSKSSKARVALITGGWSGEREISLATGRSMKKALDRLGKYDVFVIDYQRNLLQFAQQLDEIHPDVALLAIHGSGAEDGILQSLLEVAQIPYTSTSVASSAVGMNKAFSYSIAEKAGILVPRWALIPIDQLTEKGASDFTFPYVLKPCSEGSSLGVSIIHNNHDLQKALHTWHFGEKALVQEYIPGKELQVAVVFDKVLGVLEIQPGHEFFDYEAKYTAGLTRHIFPAQIPDIVYQNVINQTKIVVQALECTGIVRQEFIYGDNGQLYFLEVNTLPGMTDVSIIPDIAQKCGISYDSLIESMIEQAKLYLNVQSDEAKAA